MKKTIVDLFEGSVKQYPNNTFLWEKKKDKFEPTSYKEVQDQVYALGAGLMALGVKKGDHMALLSEGRNAWIIGELAMFYAGATNVPLSIKLEEANDLLFRLQHADVKYIVVSGNQLKKIQSILDKLPLVEKVILFDEQPQYGEKEISMNQVIELGKDWLKEHSLEELLTVAHSLTNDDYATITYTSGTTADPKGVILTHRNYTANVEQSLTCVDIDSNWRTLVILPLDHCFAHVVGFYIFMSQGASVATVQVGRTGMETLKNIPINIKEIKPYLILSVPALAKSFKKNIEQGINAKGDTVKSLFNIGLKIAYIYNGDGGDDKGRGWRFILKPLVALFDKIVFSKVRENFGGELRFFIGGGALLDKDLQKFYYAIGLPMYQGYGLSEATPVISTNGPRRHKFGSSGVLVQPLDVKICDNDRKELPKGEKGEIVIHGENVMAGYWKNPSSTQETIIDGWLYTGDMGYMSEDNLLYVLGRFKSLLIGSDGEKYSPEGIEEALVEHSPSIDQLILYNNQNPYTVALLVPNKEYLKKNVADFASEEGKEEAIRLILKDINKFKKGGELFGMFPERWLPASFAVLPEPFTEQNGMVNSTMKIVRGKVEKAYANRIEYLYLAEGKNPLNSENKKSL
ncbi:AMP-binding protein [Massilibacteroides sp.]|uniref:AMP-dependent synthetase/ligase n=1 Tax=Massilibacteroides sp. TaxID=2034766 RepID=UPI00260C4E24|nr:AMP-binding protein [Massilibacteroides sp.]MDD4514591.1 AMP-binding protein [Massilibacteroides sp.]